MMPKSATRRRIRSCQMVTHWLRAGRARSAVTAPGRRLTSATLTSAQPDARIHDTIEDVRDHVADDEGDGVDDNGCQNHRIIPIADRLEQQPANTRDTEEDFHEEGAGEQAGEGERSQGDD